MSSASVTQYEEFLQLALAYLGFRIVKARLPIKESAGGEAT